MLVSVVLSALVGIFSLGVDALALEKLDLAVFAEKFIAIFALKRFVRELHADNALDLFHHFLLQFVLDLVHFDVE